MIERLLLTAGIIGILGVTVAFSGFMQRTRVSQTARQFVDGRTPTLLYFWSEVCTPCKTVQTPALDQLEADMPMLDVVRINALEQPELASKWGVMTVPTTILLNEEG